MPDIYGNYTGANYGVTNHVQTNNVGGGLFDTSGGSTMPDSGNSTPGTSKPWYVYLFDMFHVNIGVNDGKVSGSATVGNTPYPNGGLNPGQGGLTVTPQGATISTTMIVIIALMFFALKK